MNEIDHFIDAKVHPELITFIAAFRKLIQTDYPDIKEEMRSGTEKYYGVPVYKLNRIIITLSPTKDGVTFSFSNGAKFADSYHLLEGAGNKTKNYRVRIGEPFKKEIFTYYINQAIELDR